MEKLFEQFQKLLRETDTSFFRYIYTQINWQSRMIGLTGPRGVGKTTLVLQYIKNLIYSLANDNSNRGTLRETFFLNQMRVKYDVIESPVADFLIGDHTFEVGGKNKGLKQIQGMVKAFIVKDDIELGYLNTIPLWQFGLTY